MKEYLEVYEILKEAKKKKNKRVDLDTRPTPNPLFRNYDYTAAGPNATSPGGGPYFGTPGGGEKSMGDWIKKRRKANKTAQIEKDYKDYERSHITLEDDEYNIEDYDKINQDYTEAFRRMEEDLSEMPYDELWKEHKKYKEMVDEYLSEDSTPPQALYSVLELINSYMEKSGRPY